MDVCVECVEGLLSRNYRLHIFSFYLLHASFQSFGRSKFFHSKHLYLINQGLVIYLCYHSRIPSHRETVPIKKKNLQNIESVVSKVKLTIKAKAQYISVLTCVHRTNFLQRLLLGALIIYLISPQVFNCSFTMEGVLYPACRKLIKPTISFTNV